MGSYKKKYYNLNTKLKFGKYAGCTLEWLIDNSPLYIGWCLSNLDHFMISNDTLDIIKQRLKNQKIFNPDDIFESINNCFEQKKDKCSQENNYIPDNNESYGQYAGTYAQDCEDLSDDFINDVLDGDPDAYWNLD